MTTNSLLGGAMPRRRALSTMAGGLSAAMLGPGLLPRLLAAHGGSRRPRRKLILLWLEGGPSQMETFDPKPGTEGGGPFAALPTDVQGWSFCETLPGLARRAEQLAVLRTMTSKEGNHSRARELVKTGYVPNPSVAFPSLGSIVSLVHGHPDQELPAFVQVNGAPSPSGYLGVEHAPLVLSDPDRPIDNLDYAGGVDRDRMDRREDMLEILERGFERRGGGVAVQANRSLRDRARRLMDSRLRARFDLDEEKEALRDRYGRDRFGQGCLLARRLIEAEVPAVEVVLPGWDTHDDNFNRSKALCEPLDRGFSALLDDLKERELNDEVVVVCMGEFGRTPRITGNEGRNHWPRNWCACLSGGGLQLGRAIGRTSPEGEQIEERPIEVPELFATLATVLGIDGERERTVNNRPITLIDTAGAPIDELLRA